VFFIINPSHHHNISNTHTCSLSSSSRANKSPFVPHPLSPERIARGRTPSPPTSPRRVAMTRVNADVGDPLFLSKMVPFVVVVVVIVVVVVVVVVEARLARVELRRLAARLRSASARQTSASLRQRSGHARSSLHCWRSMVHHCSLALSLSPC
jgi:hypothetical protein